MKGKASNIKIALESSKNYCKRVRKPHRKCKRCNLYRCVCQTSLGEFKNV